MKKKAIIAKILLILLMLSSCKNKDVAFSHSVYFQDADELYQYEWGLKNNGNFFFEEEELINSYISQPINADNLKNHFYNDANIFNNLIKYTNGVSRIVAKKGIDTNWENAYKEFQKIEKQECIVAIIDTGMDINHIEIKDNVINKGWNFIDNTSNVFTDKEVDSHATHIAGLIVAKHENGGIKGIAYDEKIKILPVKVIGKDHKGNAEDIVEGIKYAINKGAKICNLSLGIKQYYKEMEEVIKNNPDVLFVVAAGNGGDNLKYTEVYPAKFNYDNVITVGNIGFNGKRFNTSNYGEKYVDVFAPGTYIVSIKPENEYGILSGTSISNGFVTGLCAMIKSTCPHIPISKYKDIISLTVTEIGELDGKCKSKGVINMEKALVLALKYEESEK